MTIRLYTFIFLSFFCHFSLALAEDETNDPRESSSEEAWIKNIKPAFFSGQDIFSDGQNNIITIKAPYKAENPAIVPISIETNTAENISIQKIYIFIDKNPSPLVGVFNFTDSGEKTDLAMRVRVNDYSFIRVIAETNDGRFYMSKSFVKASGGCSAPAGPGATKYVGKMKSRLLGRLKLNKPNLMQLKIKHPNYSGLESVSPGGEKTEAFYIRNLKVILNDKQILDANITFSISTDPSFRFFIEPEHEGLLRIEATDTKNNTFTHDHILDHNNVSIN